MCCCLNILQIVNNIIECTNQLLDAEEPIIAKSQRKTSSSSSLLKSLDKLAVITGSVVKTNNETISVKRNNIALTVSYLTRNNFTINTVNSSTNQVEVVISLKTKTSNKNLQSWMSIPDTTFSNQSELVYSYFFKSSVLFLTKTQLNPRNRINGSRNRYVQSTVLSASFESGAKWNLRKPIRIKFAKSYHADVTGNNSCQFWDFEKGKKSFIMLPVFKLLLCKPL